MRRVAVGILCMVIWAISPGIAAAVDDVTIEVVQAPPPNSALRGDDPFPISMRATADSTLRSFGIRILLAEDLRPGMEVKNGSIGKSWNTGTTTSETLSLSWNTKTVTPYNGLYRVVATAESHLDGAKTVELNGYAVDNLPAVVSDVKAELRSGAPSLSWQPNTEPDHIAYHVYRSVGDSSYQQIAVSTSTNFTDSSPPKGRNLSYYVVAARRSVVSKEGWIESTPSKSTSFFIPLPQSNAQPTVSAPQEAPAAPPVPKVEARPGSKIVHNGFGELLPYGTFDGSQPEVPAPLSEQEGPAIFQPTVQSSGPTLPQVYKPPFFAAALLMIAAAAHIGRLAISMFLSGETASPTGERSIEPASSF